MMHWQPIETAPKSGANILIYDGEEIVVAFWNRWVLQGEDRGWWCLKYDSEDDWGFNKPTHWMPLPEPPSGRRNHRIWQKN